MILELENKTVSRYIFSNGLLILRKIYYSEESEDTSSSRQAGIGSLGTWIFYGDT